MKTFLSLLFLFLTTFLFSQQKITDYTGTWDYQVLNTPSGDYFGQLIISKKDGIYHGVIHTKRGEKAIAKIKKMEGDSVILSTNVEGFFSFLKGSFKGTIIEGEVSNEFSGEAPYEFYAQKKVIQDERKIRTFQLKDEQSKETISFAHIYFEEGGTVTNEDGLFTIKKQHGTLMRIAAIGYEERTITINWLDKQLSKTINLTPTVTLLPSVDIKAKSLKAKDIVKAAINRIPNNYHQSAHNAELFFRFKFFNEDEKVVYHVESILDFYDAEGYQKKNWRKAIKTRFTKLKQGRVIIGENKDKIDGLNNITAFWGNEPIVTRDKPFALESLEAYDYQLLGITKLGAEEVYKISFDCKKLKERYTGLSNLKAFSGTLFINKKDYALIRYESCTDYDYSYSNKASKKHFGGAVRIVDRINKIELFTKIEEQYISTYTKVDTQSETHILTSGEIRKGSQTNEIQVLTTNFKTIQPLQEDLWEINENVPYNSEFWDKFTIVVPRN